MKGEINNAMNVAINYVTNNEANAINHATNNVNNIVMNAATNGEAGQVKKPALMIIAAGIGRRFGGLKQITPVGPSGELIIDYSIYDAVNAGFGEIIFVISKNNEVAFRDVIGDRTAERVKVSYAYQTPDDLPAGFALPAGRAKPWGTGHAVYSGRHLIGGPFAVINADDFYGADAMRKLCAFLTTPRGDAGKTGKTGKAGIYNCCMIGYHIENTMTEHGHVARGICEVSADGRLLGVNERTRIEYRGGGIAYTEDGVNYTPIERGTVVSMNIWGFPGALIHEFEPSFRRFLSRKNADYINDEFFLPSVVGELLARQKADVRVIGTDSIWYGITYLKDSEHVKRAIRDMVRAGAYPEKL